MYKIKTYLFYKKLIFNISSLIVDGPNAGEQYQCGVLTKLYDTREAVKEATKNNDLVIVADDSSNDAVMLNPGLYLQYYLTDGTSKRYTKIY